MPIAVCTAHAYGAIGISSARSPWHSPGRLWRAGGRFGAAVRQEITSGWLGGSCHDGRPAASQRGAGARTPEAYLANRTAARDPGKHPTIRDLLARAGERCREACYTDIGATPEARNGASCSSPGTVSHL
jgi:hypothetical protein